MNVKESQDQKSKPFVLIVIYQTGILEMNENERDEMVAGRCVCGRILNALFSMIQKSNPTLE
jgi:hypothetical protein